MDNNQKIYYRRNLPHYHPLNSCYFITFRLANSLPWKIIKELKKEFEFERKKLNSIKEFKLKEKELYAHEKRYFGKFDSLLDFSESGSTWLKDKRIAKIVNDTIQSKNSKEYELLAFCIMPNHVHLVIDLRQEELITVTRDSSREQSRLESRVTNPVTQDYSREPARLESRVTGILRKLKGATAREANKILNRTGQFWHHESYDHVVRNEKELERIINYVLNNPVKAGFVKKWDDWEWNYCNSRFISKIFST